MFSSHVGYSSFHMITSVVDTHASDLDNLASVPLPTETTTTTVLPVTAANPVIGEYRLHTRATFTYKLGGRKPSHSSKSPTHSRHSPKWVNYSVATIIVSKSKSHFFKSWEIKIAIFSMWGRFFLQFLMLFTSNV